MKLLTKELSRKLKAQFAADANITSPLAKFFNPSGAATWLILGQDPEAPDQLFGLCDLGMGFPEMGYISLSELERVRTRLGLGMERDRGWEALYPLAVYANAARTYGKIVEDEARLAEFA